MTPNVTFEGEAGQDDGGLMREFFTLSIQGINKHRVEGTMAIFEGPPRFKAPCCSTLLCDMRVMRSIGRLVCQAVLHGVHGMVGVSPAIQHALIYPDSALIDAEDPPMFQPEDIPLHIKGVIDKLISNTCWSLCFFAQVQHFLYNYVSNVSDEKMLRYVANI